MLGQNPLAPVFKRYFFMHLVATLPYRSFETTLSDNVTVGWVFRFPLLSRCLEYADCIVR